MDLLDSFITSLPPSDTAAAAVRNYLEWQTGHRAANFTPGADDDVDLRTYLLHLRTNGADRAALEEQVAALKRFYQWAQTSGVITHSPFDDYDFDHPFLTSIQIDARQQTLPNDPRERELERLRALSQITEQLNSTEYQAAVKNNDAVTMDRILADDFTLVTGRGKMYSKTDLIDAAKNKDAIYEYQDDTRQTVRVWGRVGRHHCPAVPKRDI